MMIRLILRLSGLLLVFFLLASAGAVALPVRTEAANPPWLFVTWHANTYIPPFYKGKSLPISRSSVSASLSLISNGSIVDLRNQTVYWYINGNLTNSGRGITRISFITSIAPNTLDLRVVLPDYGDGTLSKSISVPLIAPEVVIDAPFPQNQFSASSIHLQGYPFFFNTLKTAFLRFAWSANGKFPETSEDPEGLTVTMPSGAEGGARAEISLDVENPLNQFETGQSGKILIYKNP